jgi:peptide chain release factor 3
MQFEVALDRFTREFNTPVSIDPPRSGIIRRVDADVARVLRGRGGVEVLERANGELMAVFRSRTQLDFFEQDHPAAVLGVLAAG